MPLIRAGGRDVHVQEMGDEGPPLVLVHPLTYSLAVWYFTVAPLLAKSLRVILYDLRGHGRSEFAREGYDLHTLGADLRALLDAVVEPAGRPVHVGGFSSGGTVALRFAADHPERIRSVTAVDAPMPPFDLRERLAEAGRDLEDILDHLAGGETDVTDGSRREDRRRSRNYRLRTETTFGEDLESEPGFWEEASRIERPVLLLYGDESPFLEVGRRLDEELADADLQVIPGSHRIPLEQRERVAERMITFLT